MINTMRSLAAATLAGLVLAPAMARGENPTLSVTGGSGRRGEPVSVVVGLANDSANAAVTADLDVDFPTDLVSFTPPVRTNCTIAPRLAATHQVGGTVPTDGTLRLAIFARGMDIVPLGDGDLATCRFDILPDAMDSPAPLTIAFTLLGNPSGLPLPVTAADGAIAITDAPNQPTPTVVPATCAGDCNGDGEVLVNEVILGVNIALENQPLSVCPVADTDGDGVVLIGEIITAVKHVIGGC
jgi:hypothetical protein